MKHNRKEIVNLVVSLYFFFPKFFKIEIEIWFQILMKTNITFFRISTISIIFTSQSLLLTGYLSTCL